MLDADAVVSPPGVAEPVAVLTVGKDVEVAAETRRALAGA